MLIFGLIIHLSGNYFLQRFLFSKNKNFLISKLSGCIIDLIVIIIINIYLSFALMDYYLPNRNAIYGINCNQPALDLGLKNEDKIISINNDTLDDFDEILPRIYSAKGNFNITLKRKNKIISIQITDSIKKTIFKNHIKAEIKPIEIPLNHLDSSNIQKLKYIKNKPEILNRIKSNFSQTFKYLRFNYEQKFMDKYQGGFISVNLGHGIYFFYGIIELLSLNLTLIVILNLIPIPGFEMGNLIIAKLEKENRIKQHTGKIIKICSLALAIIALSWVIFFL
jgi:membrane-associated protease RseP (regulator of RpoE activity)